MWQSGSPAESVQVNKAKLRIRKPPKIVNSVQDDATDEY